MNICIKEAGDRLLLHASNTPNRIHCFSAGTRKCCVSIFIGIRNKSIPHTPFCEKEYRQSWVVDVIDRFGRPVDIRFGQRPRVACSVAAFELKRVVAFSRIVLTENVPIHNVWAGQIVVRQSKSLQFCVSCLVTTLPSHSTRAFH